ncbi:MAG TPA: sigma-70 family RNA polymerase sigma factor [Acidimicrobiales bacterium]|nr:sigma-70 family RNA polymerase sigma factor [Acidimicrobiales bacterium]
MAEEPDWTAVFIAEAPRLRRLARRLAGEAVADDVVQETFFRVYRRRDTIEPGRPLRSLLTTVARRAAIDAVRNEDARTRLLHKVVDLDARHEGVEDAVINGIRREAISDVLGELTVRQRQALIAAFMEPGAVSSSVATKSALARGRRAFRTRYLAVSRETGVFGTGGLAYSLTGRLRAGLARLQALADQVGLVPAACAGALGLSVLMSGGGAASFARPPVASPEAALPAVARSSSPAEGNQAKALVPQASNRGSAARPGDGPAVDGAASPEAFRPVTTAGYTTEADVTTVNDDEEFSVSTKLRTAGGTHDTRDTSESTVHCQSGTVSRTACFAARPPESVRAPGGLAP